MPTFLEFLSFALTILICIGGPIGFYVWIAIVGSRARQKFRAELLEGIRTGRFSGPRAAKTNPALGVLILVALMSVVGILGLLFFSLIWPTRVSPEFVLVTLVAFLVLGLSVGGVIQWLMKRNL
jgi:hypothetical protein